MADFTQILADTLIGVATSFLSSQILEGKVYGGVKGAIILTIVAVVFSILGGYYLCPAGFDLIMNIYKIYKKNKKKLPKP